MDECGDDGGAQSARGRLMAQEQFAEDSLTTLLDLEDRAEDLLQAGAFEDAIAMAEAALAIDPKSLTALLVCTQAQEVLGRVAKTVRDEKRSAQIFLAEPSDKPSAPAVLILSSTGKGNVPDQHLLPRAKYSRIFWFPESLPERDDELPPYDIVFNAVGDLDAAPQAHALAAQFAKISRRPLLNLPDRVGRTSRTGVAELLQGCEGAVIPKVRKITRPASGWTQDACAGLSYPLIVRPTGGHGGEGVVLIERPEQFLSLVPDAPVIYATEFFDYRSPDSWYRKYRAIFIDRKPYPYHLAIGPNWLVHHWTTGMEQDAARREEELRFLTNPKAVLGDSVWATLEDIGATLDLDFAGIDFSVPQDGRLLLFEANPTMLVHPEDDPLFTYKNAAVQNILDAFDRMMARNIDRD
jgi:hypothetical protein